MRSPTKRGNDLTAAIDRLEQAEGKDPQALSELKQIANDRFNLAACLAKLFVDAGESVSMFLIPLKRIGAEPNGKVVEITVKYAPDPRPEVEIKKER